MKSLSFAGAGRVVPALQSGVRYRVILIGLVLLGVTIVLSSTVVRRPPRRAHSTEMFQGVTYSRVILTAPRPLVAHIVAIDLRAPGIDFIVTPGDTGSELETRARTAAGFCTRVWCPGCHQRQFFQTISPGQFLVGFLSASRRSGGRFGSCDLQRRSLF